MATLALASLGAVGANAIGISASIGWTVGATVGNMLFADGVETKGPRISDPLIGQASEGSDIPLLYGHCRAAGQLVWRAPVTEYANTQEAGKGIGGGASHTSYTYTLSFAVLFGAPRNGNALLRRLWINKKLAVNRSGDGEAAEIDGLRMDWLDGSQTDADPTIEAYVGTNNAPAFAGFCGVVFEDLNITELSNNSMPLIEAEICIDGTNTVTSTEYTLLANSSDSIEWCWYSDYRQMLVISAAQASGGNNIWLVEPNTGTIVERINLPSGNRMSTAVVSGYKGLREGLIPATGDLLIYNDKNSNTLVLVDLQDMSTLQTWTSVSDAQFMAESDTYWLWYDVSGSVDAFLINKLTYERTNITKPASYSLLSHAIATDDARFLCAIADGSSDNYFVELYFDHATAAWAWGTPVALSDSTYNVYSLPVQDAAGLIWWPIENPGNAARLISTDIEGTEVDDLDISSIGGSTGSYGASSGGQPALHYHEPSDAIYFRYDGKIKRFDCSAKTCEFWSDGLTSYGSMAIYHHQTGKVWTAGFSPSSETRAAAVNIHAVDKVTIDTEDAIEDLAELAGIAAASLNVPSLETIGGFVSYQQGSAREPMEQLLLVSMAEAVQSDYKLKVVELGGSVVDTVDANYMGASDVGQTVEPVTTKLPDHIDPPRKLQLRYISSDTDCQGAMAVAEWYSAGSDRIETISLNVTMTDTKAIELAHQILHSKHTVREYRFSLPRKYCRLEPTDPVNITDQNGETQRVRITQADQGVNGVQQFVALSDNTEDLQTDGIVGGHYVEDAAILSNSPPQIVLLDTPTLIDEESSQPGPNVTAFTYGSGFVGAIWYESVDGQTYNNFNSSFTEPQIGRCSTVPVDVDFETWDETNSLTVDWYNTKTLSTMTEAAVLDGGNAIAWGKPGRWEIIQCKTVTAVDSDTDTLSNLLRGRRGTEGHMDAHEDGDWIVVLSTDAVKRLVLSTDTIGKTRFLKAAKPDQLVSDAIAYDYTVSDTALVPYSPVDLAGTASGSDIDITWNWRTRSGGIYGGTYDLTDGVAGNMSDENSGDLQILDTDFSTVLNTYSVSGESYTYTAANIASDHGGSAPDVVIFRIRQDSAVSGVTGNWSPVSGYADDSDKFTVDVIKSSPDSWHRLGESSGTTATDYIGSDDGTYAGGYTLSAANSYLTDNAVTLNGSSGRITGLTGYYTNTATVSIEFLFKHNMTSMGCFYSESNSTTSAFQIRIDTGSSGDELRVFIRDQGYTTETITHQNTGVNDDAWHYAVFVQESNTSRKLYVDGVVSSTTGTTALNTLGTLANITVGAFNASGTYSDYFNGEIDELIRHNRALSAQEISDRWAALTT